MLWKKPLPLILLQIDAIALIAYLNIFRIADNSTHWFENVAMPIVLALWAVAAIFILWYRKPRRKTYTAIAATVAINVISYVMEICINMFISGKLQFGISAAVTACSIPLIIFFVAMVKSKKLNAWASRKFFM
jgi:CHASE2 domain-containing sensor protein